MKDLEETLEEKSLLAKLLLRTQQAYEERELLLHHYLGEDNIERLISERIPPKDATTVAAKYLHAVCEQNLKSFAVNPSCVSLLKITTYCHPANDDISLEID